MERKENMNHQQIWLPVLIMLLVAIHSVKGHSQKSSYACYDSLVMEAFFSGNMNDWSGAIKTMHKAYENNPDDTLLLHLTIAEYGMTGYLIGNDYKDEGKKHLERCIQLSEKLEDTPFKSEALAIRAGTYGYKTGLHPFKAPIYGKKNRNYVAESMELKKANPMAWMEMGNSYYHMPGIFGGSYEKAVKYYSNALKLFSKAHFYPLWLTTNTKIWLGKSYADDGNKEKARQIYLEILEKHPGFDWIEKDLLPELE